jgi:geranylgeranyl diphosphate synthase, type II
MLVKAFRLLEKYPEPEFKQLTSLFSRTAIQVCEGQQLDMNFEQEDEVTVEEYIRMITCKTAVLLGCSLQMGAINGNAAEREQQNIYEFGKHLGIAFQLMDDYLDVYAESAEFGKQPCGDILCNKKTYLLIKAFELASDRQGKELKRLLRLTTSQADEKIEGVKNIFDELDIKTICLEKADQHTRTAITHLEYLAVNQAKKVILKQFALDLLQRRV